MEEEGQLVVRQGGKLCVQGNKGASASSSLSGRSMVRMTKEK